MGSYYHRWPSTNLKTKSAFDASQELAEDGLLSVRELEDFGLENGLNSNRKPQIRNLSQSFARMSSALMFMKARDFVVETSSYQPRVNKQQQLNTAAHKL